MSFSSTLATQVTLSFKTDVNSNAKAIFRLSAQIEGIKNILSTNNDVILEGLIAGDPSKVLSLMPTMRRATFACVTCFLRVRDFAFHDIYHPVLRYHQLGSFTSKIDAAPIGADVFATVKVSFELEGVYAEEVVEEEQEQPVDVDSQNGEASAVQQAWIQLGFQYLGEFY
ncbi:hypothetical protein M422DRAFT_784222 [Sphaerobolus stellatus SS14]|uniref:Uncharacterized protein n=1 Tax=Sphaerobolus stellatus (strain SS14) TaxID=990650 RepID=A0A0C9ULK1_SPHS4|nr:hypothetical protein M422DRAFT_784222 [Sphaerobolus stellatus SS14]